MRSKLLLLSFIVVSVTAALQAQMYHPAMDELRPTSPNVTPYTRITEVPVSQYTGTAAVSVPLYKIQLDGIELPLTLNYTSNGIRLNQDASWVGLGWDMTFGTIVQYINDEDDFKSGITKLKPDYHNVPLATEYHYRYNYPSSEPGYNYTTTGPVVPIERSYGAKVATHYWFPLNGNNNYQNQAWFENHRGHFDSEPDIFVANFFGHSVKFTWDENFGRFFTLNNHGYTVKRNSDSSWVIKTPKGEAFWFEKKAKVQSNTQGKGIFGATSSWDVNTMNTWVVTKIVTAQKQVITFDYFRSAPVESFPTFTHKWQKPVQHSSFVLVSHTLIKAFVDMPLLNPDGNWINKTVTTLNETKLYPSRINFPGGMADFHLSDRLDQNNSKKLDSIVIKAGDTRLRYAMNYSYYDTVSFFPSGEYLPFCSQRLRLDSLAMADNGRYYFEYDNQRFPRKTAFSQDYWGYHNGNSGNSSLAPNAAHFKKADSVDNGNNHGAMLVSAQMGILKKIKYPTGGSAKFEYDLNTFNNVWYPNYFTNTNTSSTGMGLRIQSITLQSAENTQSKKYLYTYYGGKVIQPSEVFTSYPITIINQNPAPMTQTAYMVHEATTSNSFSSSPLASINGVGYDSVRQTLVDSTGATLGWTTNYFVNNPDRTYKAVAGYAQQLCALPAMKWLGEAENGSPRFSMIYDSGGKLRKKLKYGYTVYTSSFDYGARLGGRWNLNYHGYLTHTLSQYPQHLIGFYPVWDFYSKCSATWETSYSNAGDSMTVLNGTGYNNWGLISYTSKTVGSETDKTEIDYPWDVLDDISGKLIDSNMIATPLMETTWHNNSIVKRVSTQYEKIGTRFSVVNKATEKPAFGPGTDSSNIYYLEWDDVNGRPIHTLQNWLNSRMIYDYSRQYLTAEVIYHQEAYSIGYTSFEADNKGYWEYSAAAQDSAVEAFTGKRYFRLNNNISYAADLKYSEAYTVSYWSKNGAYSVNGTAPVKTGRTVNGWTYYEHDIPEPSTIYINGVGLIDELRLYPRGAFMTTYTHHPMLGLRTVNDQNNRVTYYEYEKDGKLKVVRDQDGNILKKHTYSYKGDQ